MKPCTISGLVLTPAGDPVVGALVRARLLGGNVVNGAAVSGAPVTVTTDEGGGFEVDLPQGERARIQIPEAALDCLFVVPARSSVDFGDLSRHTTPDPMDAASVEAAFGGPR
jgi:hypothetical protein